jgi:tRNA-binding protein
LKKTAPYDSFDELDIRIGRVLKVEDARTRKPTYRLTIDFGPEVGVKRSCGAYRNYRPEDLIGRLIVGVVNFGPKQMGPEISEVLVLGVTNADGNGTIHLTTESDVPLGAPVF